MSSDEVDNEMIVKVCKNFRKMLITIPLVQIEKFFSYLGSWNHSKMLESMPETFDDEYTTIGTSRSAHGPGKDDKGEDLKITYPLKGITILHYLTFHLNDSQESGDIIEFIAKMMLLDVNKKHFVPYDLSYGHNNNLGEFQKEHGYLENGITPIHYASSLGKYYHVKAFLHLKADINITTVIKQSHGNGNFLYYPNVIFKCQSLGEETNKTWERQWKNLTHMGGTIESDAFSLYKNFNGMYYAFMFNGLEEPKINMIKTNIDKIVKLVEKYKSSRK